MPREGPAHLLASHELLRDRHPRVTNRLPHRRAPPPPSAETDKWKKISYAFIPFCFVYAGFVVVRHSSHHHDHEEVRASRATRAPATGHRRGAPVCARGAPPPPSPPPPLPRRCNSPRLLATSARPHPARAQEAPKYPWMKKRDKAMPWTLAGGSSCDLFDYTCSAKEKAAKAALAEE